MNSQQGVAGEVDTLNYGADPSKKRKKKDPNSGEGNQKKRGEKKQ